VTSDDVESAICVRRLGQVQLYGTRTPSAAPPDQLYFRWPASFECFEARSSQQGIQNHLDMDIDRALEWGVSGCLGRSVPN
jgi:hypothetical protein